MTVKACPVSFKTVQGQEINYSINQNQNQNVNV